MKKKQHLLKYYKDEIINIKAEGSTRKNSKRNN